MSFLARSGADEERCAALTSGRSRACRKWRMIKGEQNGEPSSSALEFGCYRCDGRFRSLSSMPRTKLSRVSPILTKEIIVLQESTMHGMSFSENPGLRRHRRTLKLVAARGETPQSYLPSAEASIKCKLSSFRYPDELGTLPSGASRV